MRQALTRQSRRAALATVAAMLAVIAASMVAITAASADNPGTECTGTAPDENGHITLDCVVPVPQPSTVTVTTPVPTTVTETVTSPVPTTVTSTVTATTTTAPPTTTPAPSPTTTTSTPPPGPVLHGHDITADNTGVQPGACPDGMRVFTTRPRASATGNLTCADLRQGIINDAPITITQSIIHVSENREVGNGGSARLTLRWVTVLGDNTGTYGVVGHVDCFRCNITGASDGVRFDGTNIIETWVRVRSTSSGDHNDGIQAYRASQGGSILRSNISSIPVNVAGGIWGTAPIFIADDSHGEVVIRDNWLVGGSYTLRLHESCTYRVTGNIMSGWNPEGGPVSTTNAIPGAFLEWDGNRTEAGTPVDR